MKTRRKFWGSENNFAWVLRCRIFDRRNGHKVLPKLSTWRWNYRVTPEVLRSHDPNFPTHSLGRFKKGTKRWTWRWSNKKVWNKCVEVYETILVSSAWPFVVKLINNWWNEINFEDIHNSWLYLQLQDVWPRGFSRDH